MESKSQQTLKTLKEGNRRFLSRINNEAELSESVKKAMQGQNPNAVVIGCSDSRVPVELIFDAKPGEIFAIRTAGEVLDFACKASIKYAISHFSNLDSIIILGHESCGAVKTTMHVVEKNEQIHDADLNQLINEIKQSVNEAKSNGLHEMKHCIDCNTKRIKKQVEEILKSAGKQGIKVVEAYYSLDGKVQFSE